VWPSASVNTIIRLCNKDFLDAEAIAEAVTRQNMRFDPIKTQEQLDVQAMHGWKIASRN
jgi:transposase